MLVTLLTKATTLKPELPVFAPDFQARAGPNVNAVPAVVPPPVATNGHAHPPTAPQRTTAAPAGTTPAPASQAVANTTAGALKPAAPNFAQVPEEEGYGPDEHPPHYPRPGQGLMSTLPPEQEDLQWLVDDSDRFGVFSHLYQVDPQAANAGMNGGMDQAYGGA